VVVGAKNGTGAETVTGLSTGDFACTTKATSGSGEEATGNYVFLLFDHLYAALRIKMKMNGTYNALRTIKLKEIKMRTSTNEGGTKKFINATVRLTKNVGGNPIDNITFVQTGDVDTEGSTVFKSANGQTLTTEEQSFQGHFMPQGVTQLVVTSTYDVYDKNGNCVRQNCSADNTLVISDLFYLQTTVYRGNRYTVNMTVQPTYLYVLSDPDLDSPNVTIN
jgi:hypothetical protein